MPYASPTVKPRKLAHSSTRYSIRPNFYPLHTGGPPTAPFVRGGLDVRTPVQTAPSPLQRLHTSATCTYILCTRGCTSKRCASRAPSRSNAELLRTASHSTFDRGTGRGLCAPSDGDHVWRCPRWYRHTWYRRTRGTANQPPTPLSMRRPLSSPAAARAQTRRLPRLRRRLAARCGLRSGGRLWLPVALPRRPRQPSLHTGAHTLPTRQRRAGWGGPICASAAAAG